MHNIEVLPPKQDTRWGTINTKVASCLLVMGFRLCAEQPYIRHAPADHPEKIQTSIWFDPRHPLGLSWRDPDDPFGQLRPLAPQDIEVAWRHWDDLKGKRGRYAAEPEFRKPLMWMRRAIDARHWALNKLIAPNRAIEREITAPVFKTTDLLLAFCLISRDLLIQTHHRGEFAFNAAAAKPLHQDYLNDGQDTPMQWAKRAIVQQDALIASIRQPDNTANLHMRVGANIAFVPVNMPTGAREALVRLLYT